MKFSTDQTGFGFETSVDEEKARFLSCLNKVRCKYSYVRIPKTYRPLINTLDGEIVFENEDLVTQILSEVIENHIFNNSSKNK